MKKLFCYALAGGVVGLVSMVLLAEFTRAVNEKNFADICREHGGEIEKDHGVPFCAKVVK